MPEVARNPKKGGGVLCSPNAVKYAWIQAQQKATNFSVDTMCAMLDVVRSGYYAWKVSPQSARDLEDVRLSAVIKKSFDESRQTYGCQRIQEDLKDWGEKVSKRRIGRLIAAKP